MNDDWGGIERYLYYLSEGLSERGHDVTTSVFPSSPLSMKISERKVNLPVHWKYDLLAVARLRKLIKMEKFDVAVSHFSPDYLVAGWANRGIETTKLLMTRHVAVPFSEKRSRQYLELYDGFVGVSEAVLRSMVKSKISVERIVSVLGGSPALEPKLAIDLAKEKFDCEGFNIGVFGRLVAEKGHLQGIEAVKLSGVSDAKVHIFGRGSEKEKIRQVAEKLWGMNWCEGRGSIGKGQVIHYHGYISDVADAMQAMDLILVPSQWEEAFGFVITEAMSLGIPVLAFGVGGIREIIQDQCDGILVEPGDVATMAERIRQLRGDAQLLDRIGKAGKDRHSSFFTVKHLSERTESAYLSFLNSV